MPSLNRVERVIKLMQYLQTHIGEANTVDKISKDTGIPISSIRKTIDVEFRECFSRDLYLKRNITLSGIMPYGIKFDPEPKPERVKRSADDTRRPAKYYTRELGLFGAEQNKRGSLKLVINNVTTQYAAHYAENGVDKQNKEDWNRYITIRNGIESVLLLMKIGLSKNPKRVIDEAVLDPENLPDYIKQYYKEPEQEI